MDHQILVLVNDEYWSHEMTLKIALMGAALTLSAGPLLADAAMVDALAEKTLGQILSVKMDSDANSHVYNIAIGNFGVVDTALGTNDADYEAVLAARNVAVGTAIYGNNDADYEATLTPENFFSTAALGQHDAGYEQVLAWRGVAVGTAIYGNSDADYEAALAPDDCFATAALGEYDADYEPVLAARAPLGADFFNSESDFAALFLK